MEQNTEKNMSYEEKKQLKEKERNKSNQTLAQKKVFKRFITWFVSLAILVILVFLGYSFVKKNIPEEDFSREIPLMGAEHIQIGASHEVYNSNPPTSGPHYADPAKPGFRTEEIADGHLIHSMEHGLVWVSYNPRIGAEADKLRKVPTALAVVTKRDANETDIALASWGRLDTFNLEDGTVDDTDLKRIRDFINRYVNKGPERIPAGQHSGI
ncbi:MAG: DUF3105 domain-containing protein [Parcubacteria group bacterium]|nr:DUF3105 domain-containing protein [Parcubacteria group bacterium]